VRHTNSSPDLPLSLSPLPPLPRFSKAENISVEELEYKLLARAEVPAENDFDAQVAKMLRSALKYQRARTSTQLPPGAV
jgi:hypothetical protein